MFTGLIEEVGVVQAVDASPAGSTITVSARDVLQDADIGASIAIDGVCTTIVAKTLGAFTIEASPETLSKTTFGDYRSGVRVNLERPLRPADRIGGHFVSGHVDGRARVVSVQEDGISFIYHFRLLDPALASYFIEKGSVAVDGISLTVNTIEGLVFSVAIIPHTLSHTSLGDRAPDTLVNIETDLIGKYIKRLVETGALGALNSAVGASSTPLWGTPMGPSQTIGKSTLHAGGWFNLEPPQD
ncbi:MAG: riboflavin synthase [Vampirovibrionales bacterium]|nr:riboflavin synthase [Vampirovibrionales bacterium]